MGQIHDLWPRARFLHIIRDPWDVCLSMLDWRSGERTAGQFGTWETDPVLSTALYWRLSVMGREAGAALGPGAYHEVRYEELVAFQEDSLERLCGFLRLPYAEAMMRFRVGKTRVKARRGSKAQWLPPTAGLRDRRAQLSPGDVERTEAAVGDLLVRLRYPPRLEGFTTAARERVARVHETFPCNALAADRTLPREWAC